MTVLDGGWALIAEAMADRQIDAIVAECIDEIDLQVPVLHALYELWRVHEYETVAMILRCVQGEWL